VLIVRRVGALVLALAAVAVWFGLKPSEVSSSSNDFSGEISSALSDYTTNSATAGYAPQQQVVNGWAAKDLLTVIAKEQNAALAPKSAPHDDRIPAELLLGVLGISMLAATSEREGPRPAIRGGYLQQPPAPVPYNSFVQPVAPR
jgi:hypothetical protein